MGKIEDLESELSDLVSLVRFRDELEEIEVTALYIKRAKGLIGEPQHLSALNEHSRCLTEAKRAIRERTA